MKNYKATGFSIACDHYHMGSIFSGIQYQKMMIMIYTVQSGEQQKTQVNLQTYKMQRDQKSMQLSIVIISSQQELWK